MSFILRTWGCQNNRCLATFDSGERAPACPRCGCVRVGWVPRACNVGTGAAVADRDLKTLAERFGLADLNPAYRDQAAKKVSLPANGASAGVVNFNGFQAAIDPASARSATNQSGAQCVPTANHIEHKVRTTGDKLVGQLGLPGIGANTQITHTHRAKP